MPTQRQDIDRWRALLQTRHVSKTWHFCPLVCVPCILQHGHLLSITQQERLGLAVPQRGSRDDDVRKGVGDAVKISVLPYWKMLGTFLRQGKPEVMLEFTTEPIYWEETYFGNSNVWENCWVSGTTYEFAAAKVFAPPRQWDAPSPPEIYIPGQLPLTNILMKIHTILEEERVELKNCMQRLGFRDFDVFTAGFSFPFPDVVREAYSKNQPSMFDSVRRYLRNVTLESLARGVELERFAE